MIMYDMRSNVIPSDSPQSFRVWEDILFSRTTAGNSMLPIKTRTRRRSAVECFGARRDAASTVTLDQRGGEFAETNEVSGTQCSVVDGTGSGGGTLGET